MKDCTKKQGRAQENYISQINELNYHEATEKALSVINKYPNIVKAVFHTWAPITLARFTASPDECMFGMLIAANVIELLEQANPKPEAEIDAKALDLACADIAKLSCIPISNLEQITQQKAEFYTDKAQKQLELERAEVG
jgi:hypothetical protein